MQYVGRAIGSVSKTWNSINPATLSGAIDVIVVEQENGDLACSPFHIRFGKFSLLRPSQKKVEIRLNGEKIDYLPMKLGDGGEAFFVFGTNKSVPEESLTSPIISPSSSPSSDARSPSPEPDFLDLDRSRSRSVSPEPPSTPTRLGSVSPPGTPLTKDQLIERARLLSRKLTDINIPSKITDNGDIVLDVTGYKADEDDFKQSEQVVRKILMEEFGEDNLESIITKDEEGNIKIGGNVDDGYTSDDYANDTLTTTQSEPTLGEDQSYAKTLRLTSDQLKRLNLKEGANEISFSVNNGKAVCSSRIFYWKHDVPIVISDIDGTITKSDALGHVLAMIGRDWTHPGVGKLFTDIHNNGYNIMYLTARSVGQADSTRYYLQGIEQEGYKLPLGPVILSPDRTIAALRREVILRKPEVFKMACLRDIKSLYGNKEEVFFAGFGNRITDALSYRSVGVPSSRIFTINSIGDVHMELLELAGYKSSYVHIADLVDHFFPPASIRNNEIYNDVLYWREDLPELSDTDISTEEHNNTEEDENEDDEDDEDEDNSEDDEEGEHSEDSDEEHSEDGLEESGKEN